MTISVDIDELLRPFIANNFSEHEAQNLELELQNLKTHSLSISLSNSKFPPLRTQKHQQQSRKTRQSLFDPPVANRRQPLLPNPSGEANESKAAVAKTKMTTTRGRARLAEAEGRAAADCAALCCCCPCTIVNLLAMAVCGEDDDDNDDS